VSFLVGAEYNFAQNYEIKMVYLGIFLSASVTSNIMFCLGWDRDKRREVRQGKKKFYDFMSKRPVEQAFYHLTLTILASGILLAFTRGPQILELIRGLSLPNIN
jgi:hypothetical protein